MCEWKDGSTEWIALKDIKDSYPLEIAEYAVANQIQEDPNVLGPNSTLLIMFRRGNIFVHRIARSLGFSLNSLESCVSYPMPNLLKSCQLFLTQRQLNW